MFIPSVIFIHAKLLQFKTAQRMYLHPVNACTDLAFNELSAFLQLLKL